MINRLARDRTSTLVIQCLQQQLQVRMDQLEILEIRSRATGEFGRADYYKHQSKVTIAAYVLARRSRGES